MKAKPKKPVGLRSSPATHSNLYLDYLAERDAFADGRRKWDALKTEDRANCPPGVEAETEATLTGDLSVMAEFGRATAAPDAPPIWESRLDNFRQFGDPIFALFAIALWPADKALAPELRWVLQKAFLPIFLAGEDEATVPVPEWQNEFLRALGLFGGPGRPSDGITRYRRMMSVLRAEEEFKAHRLTTKNRKEAIHKTCISLKIQRATLENYLSEAARVQESP